MILVLAVVVALVIGAAMRAEYRFRSGRKPKATIPAWDTWEAERRIRKALDDINAFHRQLDVPTIGIHGERLNHKPLVMKAASPEALRFEPEWVEVSTMESAGPVARYLVGG